MNLIFLNGQYNSTNIPQRSLGPYLLKHVLKKHNYTSQVIDFCQEFTSTQIFEFIKKFTSNETICIGLSSTFWYERNLHGNKGFGIPDNIYDAIKSVKKEFPNLKIIIGGARAGHLETMLEDVDAIFIGESEDTLLDVLDYWTKDSPEPDYKTNPINNIKIYETPVNKRYDFQYCDFMWTKEDCIVDNETLPLETTRGCVFKCRFCAYPHLGKKKFDFLKSNDSIKKQLIENYNNFKVTNYIITDDTFNDTEYKIDKFLEMTESLPFKIEFVAYVRADLVHRFPSMAEKLQRAGLRCAWFGVESLHPQASNLVGKAWSGKHAKEFLPQLLKNIWQSQVYEQCSFIVGLPGETKEDLESTLQWINDNNIKAVFIPLNIVKDAKGKAYSSEFEKNSEKYGFTFPDGLNEWQNDLWTRASAFDFHKTLNDKLKMHHFSGFNFMSLKSLGYTNEEIIDKSHHINKDQDFFQRRKSFFDSYIIELMSYSPSQNIV